MLEITPPQLPTYGQLERELSQKTCKLYREKLEHSPGKITCKFFRNNLTILIEDGLTDVEKTLLEENKDSEIVKNANLAISNIVKSELKLLIEKVLAVKVNDILFDCSLETYQAGAIVVLSQLPIVRSQKPNTKITKSQDREKPINENNSIQTY